MARPAPRLARRAHAERFCLQCTQASFTAVPSKAMVPAAMMKAPASPWNVAAFARSMSDRSGVNGRKPTMEVAKAAPRTYYEMSNEVLLSYAAQGDHEARKCDSVQARGTLLMNSCGTNLREVGRQRTHAARNYGCRPSSVGGCSPQAQRNGGFPLLSPNPPSRFPLHIIST